MLGRLFNIYSVRAVLALLVPLLATSLPPELAGALPKLIAVADDPQKAALVAVAAGYILLDLWRKRTRAAVGGPAEALDLRTTQIRAWQ